MQVQSETKKNNNIVSGVSSFIKVQMPKASKEDLEEKRLEDLRKKKERNDDISRKKDELLKMRTEEKKRYIQFLISLASSKLILKSFYFFQLLIRSHPCVF